MEGCLSFFFFFFFSSSLQKHSLSSAERVVGCTQWQKVFPLHSRRENSIYFSKNIFSILISLSRRVFPLFPVPLTLFPESTISLSAHSNTGREAKTKLGHLMYRSISTRRQFARIRKEKVELFPHLSAFFFIINPPPTPSTFVASFSHKMLMKAFEVTTEELKSSVSTTAMTLGHIYGSCWPDGKINERKIILSLRANLTRTDELVGYVEGPKYWGKSRALDSRIAWENVHENISDESQNREREREGLTCSTAKREQRNKRENSHTRMNWKSSSPFLRVCIFSFSFLLWSEAQLQTT